MQQTNKSIHINIDDKLKSQIDYLMYLSDLNESVIISLLITNYIYKNEELIDHIIDGQKIDKKNIRKNNYKLIKIKFKISHFVLLKIIELRESLGVNMNVMLNNILKNALNNFDDISDKFSNYKKNIDNGFYK